MYLKNINLRGFKSFGTRSNLYFEPGISIIVGPNGSGKSNIVDAISWVLGEQSPKSLRSSTMGDVIFRTKGEELAIAEVSLIFDNTDKTLPIDFSEVKFTRRIYLKGGSDYFINSSPCRLTDMQDLISESGMGRGLYTIVNQGQINNIILYKPSDRKQVIDEIIGISGHKSRRDKTKSRMLSVSEDINRINDLLIEVKRTMDPLEKEAEKARQYSDITSELKNAEISLFIAAIESLNMKWDEENLMSQKYLKESDEIAEEIKRISEKIKIWEQTINTEKSTIRNAESYSNLFNSLEGRLYNFNSILNNQKTSVETVINMLNFSIQNLQENLNISENKTASYRNFTEKDKKLSSDIIELLESLEETLKELFLNTKIWIGQKFLNNLNDFEEELKNKTGLLRKSLDMLCENSNKSENNLETDKEEFKDNNVNAEKIILKIKKLEMISRIASGNVNSISNFSVMLNSLIINSKKVKKAVNENLNYSRELFNKKQEGMNNYYEQLSKLSNKKNSLENELFRVDLKKEQIKEKVKDMSIKIYDEYNFSVDYIIKNFKPADDIDGSEKRVRFLKNEILKYKGINPNAHIEYEKIKERFDFLNAQKTDLTESRKSLEKLIAELNERIKMHFIEKFNEINENFKYYFKILFPLGDGELLIEENQENPEEFDVEIKADIGNNKSVSLQLLSGGEKALVSTAFLFSIFAANSSPFFIFDEIDAALDDANLDRFLNLSKIFSKGRQIIMITHQKKTMEIADVIYGFSMQSSGVTKIVSEKIKEKSA